jgi:hypothetical protein
MEDYTQPNPDNIEPEPMEASLVTILNGAKATIGGAVSMMSMASDFLTEYLLDSDGEEHDNDVDHRSDPRNERKEYNSAACAWWSSIDDVNGI